MENGHEERLADKISELTVNDSSQSPDDSDTTAKNDSLFQVMKAVEAAESTIKQQVEENNRLRSELQKRIQELENYKLDESIARRPKYADQQNEHVHLPYEVHQAVPSISTQDDKFKNIGGTSTAEPLRGLRQDLKLSNDAAGVQNHSESHFGSGKVNGALKATADSASLFHLSSPSTASFSPTRHQIEGEYDPRFNSSGHGLMPMAEVNNTSSIWKQEAQIRNEKYVLEKRISYMRLAFDQQQQDLVDAASKALSYRQDIIEENIRLTYALQAAQEERTTFVSSLLPLLAEYSLQPPAADAQSIVSNVKILFKHLQEKLIFTESKLKESQYQLAPWRSDVNNSNFAAQSPSPSIGAGLTISNKNALELVPQQAYSHGPISSDVQTGTDWDLHGHHQGGLGGVVGKNVDTDEFGRYSPLASRNSAPHEMPAPLAVTRAEAYGTRYNEDNTNRQVTFRDPVSNSEVDDLDAEGNPNEREPPNNWSSGNSPYQSTLDDPSSSYFPYLPPVLEEPSSSFSEAAEDDPLPAIEGLQISGEAFPGRELQACGYSINGTTSCNFEWVRHMEDGSVNYIEGAKQPTYLVTADDVDTYLAIEVQPLDNRKRKGELVKVFANEHRKITCDPEMQSHIEKILQSGHASYKVSLSAGYLDIWEPAALSIKREGYSIKCSGSSGVVVTEKFSATTSVTIPYGQATELLITGSNGFEHLLRVDNNSTDITCSRDAVVLTLRLFMLRASERRKGKKKGFLFNK